MKAKITKIINMYKNYKPSKQECLLYFFIPLFISTFTITLRGNQDFWFLLNHGKYVLHHGFPTTDPFSMHQGLQFVMQQWLAAVLFYLFNLISSHYGLYIFCFIMNIFILFLLYKLCMELSNNNYRISIALAIITDLIFLLYRLIIPRPQIFTYSLLIITLIIMEKFYKNKKSKAIYYLPLISILQINFHASMYFMLYIFMLPYFVNFIYLKIKDKKDNRIFKLLLIWLIMFACAFINPYGIKAITYVFTSYNNIYITELIGEMQWVSIRDLSGKIFLSLFVCIMFLFRIFKKGKFELRQILLFLGLTYLAFRNYRNIPLWAIGVIPYLILFLKPYIKKIKTENIKKISWNALYFISIIIIAIFGMSMSQKLHHPLEKGIDKLLKNNNVNDITLYTDLISGSYAEYRGLKPYIDVRSEIFLKSNNKKENLYEEYYMLAKGVTYYKDFMNKYNFNYLIVRDKEIFFNQIINDKDYKIIYYAKCENKVECEDDGNYYILEKIKNSDAP